MKHLRTLAYLLLAASLTACGSKEQKEEENEVGRKKYEIEKNPVDTIVLRKQDFNSQLLSNGKLRALNKSSLKFANTGIVTQLYVKTVRRLHREKSLPYWIPAMPCLNWNKPGTRWRKRGLSWKTSSWVTAIKWRTPCKFPAERCVSPASTADITTRKPV